MRPATKFTLLFATLLLAAVASAQQNFINTIIGGGPNNMPAIDANLNGPTSAAVDSAGNVYIAGYTQNRIFKVDTTGKLTVVAGNGLAGYSGDGVSGGAANAMLYNPNGVAVDSLGNVYIADYSNYVIRKVDTTGTITTVAGIQGSCTYDGDTITDGKPATQHSLCQPDFVAVDASNNVLISDTGTARIRKLTGTSISTVAGGGGGAAGYCANGTTATSCSFNYPNGVAVDTAGDIFLLDTNQYVVYEVVAATGKIKTVAGTPGTPGFSGDGGLATSATFTTAYGLSVNGAGTTVLLSDTYNNRVRQFTVGGKINTVAGSGCGGFSGDGGPATAACVWGSQGSVMDSAGNLYIPDYNNYRVRKVSAGIINTIAGNGSTTQPTPVNGLPATSTVLNYALGVMQDPAGNTFVADSNNNMVRELMQSTGNINIFAGITTAGYTGDGGLATNAQMSAPSQLARDSVGNIYIADTYNCAIRKVDTAGNISTFAGDPGGTVSCAYSGDGGPATSAQLYYPFGVFVDSHDNLFIADTYNHVIREVQSGTISTVAGSNVLGYSGDGGPATSAKLYYPYGVAADSAGNIIIADTYNQRVRVVNAQTKIINTLAGNGTATFSGDGPATQNSIYYPQTVAVDANDNVFIADTSNQRIRWVDAGGTMTTIAGNGTAGFSGDGASALSAMLYQPTGIFEDASGNLLVSDSYNFRIRKINAAASIGRSTGSLMFSTTAVGVTVGPSVVTLSGIGPASISNITTSGDFSEVDDCGGALPNGTTCAVDVYFTPTGSGTRTGTLTITSNGLFSPTQTVALQGSGAAISISPSPLAFGNQISHTSVTKPVTVKNNGATAIAFGAVTLTNTTDYAIASNTCTGSLAGHATCTIGITFTPQSIGAKKGVLIVNDSDPTTPQLVGLTGTGTGFVTLTPTSLTFATTVLNTTTVAQKITVKNTGTTTVTLAASNAVVASGNFAIAVTGTTCLNSLALAHNATCFVNVTFTPTTIGPLTGTVTITDSDPSSPQTAALSGTGTEVKLSAPSINFGTVTRGVTVNKTLTLTNVGTTALTINSVTFSGTNAADYATSTGNPPCGGTVAAGANCVMTLQFTPTIVGAEKATFSISDNGGGSPHNVALTGTGK